MILKIPVDIFGTVVGENPDCLLLSGTVVGENPDHVCWDGNHLYEASYMLHCKHCRLNTGIIIPPFSP